MNYFTKTFHFSKKFFIFLVLCYTLLRKNQGEFLLINIMDKQSIYDLFEKRGFWHVITEHDITYYHTDVMPAFRQSRIKIQLVPVSDKPFGMDIVDVQAVQRDR